MNENKLFQTKQNKTKQFRNALEIEQNRFKKKNGRLH